MPLSWATTSPTISCTLNFVQEAHFYMCRCFIINILKGDFLKLFPVKGALVKKQYKITPNQLRHQLYYSVVPGKP